MTASIELDSLYRAAGRLNFPLSDHQVDQLIRYLDLLEAWNKTYNLTSVRQRSEMLVQHLFDCLAVVGPVERDGLPDHPLFKGRCLDVGSGGGLPGVVLAIMIPSLEVVCVDAVGKKASFVRQVALEIGLRNLYAQHARVEHLSAGIFDLVTCRAFSSLADFTSLTEKHLRTEGRWMAMKGVRPDQEIAALPSHIEVFHVEQLSVPDMSAARCLIWMKRRD